MPTSTTPWRVHVKGHPGSSAQEIKEEPDWTAGHHQRIGFKNREDFVPGVTNARDDEYDQDIERARRALKQLQDQAGEGHLLNFRDLVQNQEVNNYYGGTEWRRLAVDSWPGPASSS